MEIKDKKTVPACRLLSVHLLVLRISFARTHFDSSRPVRSHTPKKYGIRISPVSVLHFLYLAVCLCFSFLDTNRNRSCKKRSSSVPVHLLDKCEQNVNSFQSTHIQTPSLERAGGQKVDNRLTTGDVVQSIVLLNRARRRQTLSSG